MSQPSKSPFTVIFERCRRRLEMFFRRCQGRKAALFVDPGFDKVIGRIVSVSSIRECFEKIFTYNSNKTNFDFEVIVILTSGEIQHLQQYVDLLTNTKKPPGEINIIFTNTFNFVSRQFLEQEGFLHRFSFEQLRLPLWILDQDLATLEMPDSFFNVVAEGGRIAIERTSEAIRLFPNFDYFSNIYCIGDKAIEFAESLPTDFQSGWSHIIVFDRNVDLVTPFLTPFTYEAVVAEYVGIEYGIAKYKNTEGEFKKVLFSSEDAISSSVRLLNVLDAEAQIDKEIDMLEKEIKTLQEESKRIQEEINRNKEHSQEIPISLISKNTELLKKLTPKITKRNSLGKHRSILNTMHNGFRKDPGYTPISDAEIDLLFMKGLMKFIFLNSNKIEIKIIVSV